MKTTSSKEKRIRRHGRIRSRVKGTGIRPRLSVFRSNRYVWAQLIDDEAGRTIVAAGTRPNDRSVGRARETAAGAKSKKKPASEHRTGRITAAASLGEKIAAMAAEKKIDAAVFDRGGYRYHGIVQAVAEGARKGGLKF